MITIEKILFLKRISIFKSLGSQELKVIAEVIDEEELAAGEVLFTEGQQGDCMYFVVEGRIKIYTGTPPRIKGLAMFEAGDFFGEMGLYDDKPRAASAMAQEVSRLLVLRKADFCELIAEYPEVALGIMKELNQRLRATNLKLTSVEGKLLDKSGQLYSQEYFIECMSTEFLKSKKSGASLSFVVVKTVIAQNQETPLQTNLMDQVVFDIGRILTMHQRPNDLCARYREDRLVTMLCEANRDGANAFLRRVQKDLDKYLTTFSDGKGPVPAVTYALYTLPDDATEREVMLGLFDKP